MVRIFGILILLTGSYCVVLAQNIDQHDASDPAIMKSRITTDFDSYFFVAEARHYAMRFGFDYGLQNERHLFGISLPIVHAIYAADFGGYENTTGVGDLKMRYMFVAWQADNSPTVKRVSLFLEATAPTGQAELGRGTGTWVYRPGFIYTFRPNPNVSFYPKAEYQFSLDDANYLGGDAPDAGDPDLDGRIRNLHLSVPAIVTVSNWNGWFGLNATYIESFTEETYFLFMRVDFGTMIGRKTSAALNISKFIAGQPRLDVLVQAKFQFFLR